MCACLPSPGLCKDAFSCMNDLMASGSVHSVCLPCRATGSLSPMQPGLRCVHQSLISAAALQAGLVDVWAWR